MIFYYNANGLRLGVYPEKVVQGSSKANTLYFVCPLPTTNVIHVAFMLPDGQKTEKYMLKAESKKLSGVCDEFGNEFNVWSLSVPVAVTAQSGLVWAQFYSTANGETVASVRCGFTVDKGVVAEEPVHGESYDGIIEFLSGITARISEMNENNAEVRSIAEKSDKIVSSVDDRIKTLYSFFENTIVTKTVIEDKFSMRDTAGGLDIIGGTPSFVKKIYGDTVYNETAGEFVNANFKGIESYGNNLLNIDVGLKGEGFKLNESGDYMLSYVNAIDRRSEVYPMTIPAGSKVYFSVNVLESMNVDDFCRLVFSDGTSYYLSGLKATPGINTYSLKASKQIKSFEFYVHENEYIIFNSFIISTKPIIQYEKYNGDVSFQLPDTVWLGKWDYIDVERKKLVRQTEFLKGGEAFTEEALSAYSEYLLSSDGLNLCYKAPLSIETAIDIPESYFVQNKGVETVNQGDEDNSAVGVECTVVQDYYVKAGV